MKIIILVGTRPEAIKLLPLYVELLKSNTLEVRLVSTGQHKEMLGQVFNFWGIHPDEELNVMTQNQSLPGLTSKLFEGIDSIIQKTQPNCVVVQGDTTTAFVGAMVGFYHGCKVAHVEAGLRTYNKHSPFPEEINRQTIGLIADFNFCPTHTASKNLEREGKENIFTVGNTVIDSLQFAMSKVEKNKQYYDHLYEGIINNKPFILVTGHRRENFGPGLENICKSISSLSSEFPELVWVYPVHLNPKVKNVVNQLLQTNQAIQLIDPIPYDHLIYLMSRSMLIMTDSGGIQEEAPTLNKPIIVLRDTTERPEGVTAGCSRLVGTSTASIIAAFKEIYTNQNVYNEMASAENPYGDGNTSKKIREILEKSANEAVQ